MGYLYLPGTDGSYASTPDAAVLDIAGNIDLIVWAAPVYKASLQQSLLTKEGTGTDSFRFGITGTSGKRLRIVIWQSGAEDLQSTADIPYASGVPVWLRVTVDFSASECKFYTSVDGVSWTQLGSTQTVTKTAFDTGPAAVGIGAFEGGTGATEGNFYRAQIYDGIDGTLVFDADFTDLTTAEVNAGSFTEDSPNAATVTLNGTGWTYFWDSNLLMMGVG